MTILQEVETLRQQALALLFSERELINKKIEQLGGEAEIKNGRPKKCGRCQQEGHNAKTCPTPEEKGGSPRGSRAAEAEAVS